ncbi:MFS general substrate transporter [Mycena metata]|uniref:MFS general substrate transporter n=1 Tax=Mycena metata TaxID=1033252 RepID=A0AAD7I2K9_9AGAR|nr:MFS general substrate transporter [Mycena metata]
MAHSTHTPRSSFTVFDRSAVVSPAQELEQELASDEEEIHLYGGDAPSPPPPKSPKLWAPTPRVPLDPEEITWDGPNDPANPQTWPIRKKWLLTLVCCIMTVNVTFASSAPTSATGAIVEAFGISNEASYLVTSVFLLGYVFGPLLWGPGSELIGRRPVFIFTMTLYTLFHLGQALAPNIETLLITRFLSGLFGVAPLVNGGGLIADIWPVEGRGTATSLFAASVFLGPVTGPIVAGYIVDSSLSWRWVFWVMMMFAGACTLFMMCTLPETYAPVLLLKKVKARRKADPAGSLHLFAAHEKQDWSPRGVIHRTVFRPFQMLAGEPILVLVTIYLSLIYGVMYCLFEALPIIFVDKRGFTIAQDGLVFIGIGIGTTIGAILNVLFSRHYPALIKTWRGFPPPEERLYGGMLGGCVFVIGIFWLGWTGQYASVPWYVPALSTIMVGMSISLIFISFLSYLVETYLMYSASAFAANTFCRSLVAAAFPLFTVQMFDKLGVNYAATLLGGVGILLAPSPFLFYKYGARIRANSKFAPCLDLKVAKALEEEKAAMEGKVEV